MNDYISKTSNIESKIAGPNSKDYDLGTVLNIPFNNSVASISLFPDRKVLLKAIEWSDVCLLYTSPSPRDGLLSRMPSSA